MKSARFSIVETLRFAVCAALENFLFFVGVFFAYFLSLAGTIGALAAVVLYPMRHHFAALFSQMETLPPQEKAAVFQQVAGLLSEKLGIVGLFLALAVFAVCSFFGVGLVRIALDIHDRGTSSVSRLFSGGSLVLKAMVVMGLYWIMMVFGFMCFIIPGVIAMVAFSLAMYVLVDKQCGPIEALKESARLTKGSRMHLAGLFLLMGILGHAMPVMYLVFWPVSMLALAYLYRHFQMTTASA
jgi:uncharacterized membrane protein